MLAQVDTQRTVVQEVMDALNKTSEGLRSLLEMTPDRMSALFEPDARPVRAAQAAANVPAKAQFVPSPNTTSGPKGKEAVRLILQSDKSRFWTIREVWDEQVRRGWSEPMPRGKRRNPPSRAALSRLLDDFPNNVEVRTEPTLSYRWTDQPSSSLNGSGLHSEGVPA